MTKFLARKVLIMLTFIYCFILIRVMEDAEPFPGVWGRITLVGSQVWDWVGTPSCESSNMYFIMMINIMISNGSLESGDYPWKTGHQGNTHTHTQLESPDETWNRETPHRLEPKLRIAPPYHNFALIHYVFISISVIFFYLHNIYKRYKQSKCNFLFA